MTRRPNILLMMADDHRASAIGALGIEPVQTPTMDALMRRGTTFINNRHMGSLSGAVCVPARAALHSGMDPRRATADDLWTNCKDLRDDVVTLGQTLRAAGYDTFATGKWHNDGASFNRSFAACASVFMGGMCDHDKVPLHAYDPTGEYARDAAVIGEGFSSEMFTDAAIDFIRQRDDDKPFFCYVAFTSPHDPRMAPPPYGTMYDGELPPNFLPQHPFDLGDFHIRDEELAAHPRSEEEVRRHVADYYGMITHQDAQMRRIIDAVDDNTLIIYTGDHGLAVGQHGLMGKQNLYEHSVRVPLIVAGPDVPRDHRVDALTQTPDLYPTLCAFAGAETSANVEARNLVPLMHGDTSQARSEMFCYYRHFQRMVTDGRWKLIRYYRDARADEGSNRIQLFNLYEDCWETTDFSQSPTHADRLRDMTAKLEAWQRRNDDPVVSKKKTEESP